MFNLSKLRAAQRGKGHISCFCMPSYHTQFLETILEDTESEVQ